MKQKIFISLLAVLLLVTGCGDTADSGKSVEQLILNKNSTTLVTGGSERLYVSVIPEDAAVKNLNWSSENRSIATVDTNGVINALSQGITFITVSTEDGKKSASCEVTVSDSVVPVTGISINKPTTTIITGGSEQLAVIITPSDATNQTVSWSSSNESVAAVSEGGLVTAVSTGSAKITATATDGGYYAACTVNVSAVKVAVTGISITKSSTSISDGLTEKLVVIITPSDATNQNIVWSCSNNTIASVSSGGVVSAVSAGTATVTAKSDDGGFIDTCDVTVLPVPVQGIILNKTATAISVGSTEQLTATISPFNSTNRLVNWVSSNPSVVSVDTNGIVSALTSGTSIITATSVDGSFTATCTVTAVTYKLTYKFGSYSGSYNNIYVIWIENSSKNFYYPLYICERLLGKGDGPLTGTALPYWKLNKYPLMVNSDVDAVTGATVKNYPFDILFNLPAGSPRQFIVYFETDVSYNTNAWFADQPAILYKTEIDLDNIQSSYTLSLCGWTPNEGTAGFYSTAKGVLNTILGYITNLNDGSGGFGAADSRSQTNLVDSIIVYVNP